MSMTASHQHEIFNDGSLNPIHGSIIQAPRTGFNVNPQSLAVSGEEGLNELAADNFLFLVSREVLSRMAQRQVFPALLGSWQLGLGT